MNSVGINKNVGDYVNKVSTNNFFKGALLMLGVAFTVSTVINNWYAIREHRENIKAAKERAKNGAKN